MYYYKALYRDINTTTDTILKLQYRKKASNAAIGLVTLYFSQSLNDGGEEKPKNLSTIQHGL